MYQYNGKENNTDFGLNLLDYGARWYDPTLGRWGCIDFLTEKYPMFSPYNYGINNPIKFTDPNGMDIFVGSEKWEPGKKPSGDSKFAAQVFDALNSLYKTIEAGNVHTNEAKGNVIMDFVGEGSLNVNIKETSDHSSADPNGLTINWNPNEGIHVTPNDKGNVEGDISSTTGLAHEFGHVWLNQTSPKTYQGLRNSRQTSYTDEDSFILPNVENKFAAARGEGIRTEYRLLYKDKTTYDAAKPVKIGSYYTFTGGDYWIKQ
jgi:RHS repeat-associated protein